MEDKEAESLVNKAVDRLAEGQAETFSKALSNVEAKALFNTLAKTVKYKKAETHKTTLGHVAAEGIHCSTRYLTPYKR